MNSTWSKMQELVEMPYIVIPIAYPYKQKNPYSISTKMNGPL